jgi:O-antigen/teichoic acid export membrane protein
LAALRQRYAPAVAELKGSETAKAVGLAGAMIVNNVIALGSTIVFARLLSDYGSLAALVSYFLILSVVGQALQVATAREGVLGHLGVGAGLLETLKSWTKTLLWITLGLTVVSFVFRTQIASLVGVSHDQWGAAIGVPAGCLWLVLSILRGALQGVGDYRSVGFSLIGEQSTRLVSGAVLAAVGLGVTGAYLGTPISFIVMGVYCWRKLTNYASRFESAAAEADATAPAREPWVGPTGERAPHAVLSLWAHVKSAWAPICGLVIIAILQNIDIIAAKHRFSGTKDLASSYAATAVAGKVIVWVAIGAGFYLVPEVSRRRAAGEETRGVLARAVAIIVVCAVPALLIFAVAAHQLLAIPFKPDQLLATNALLLLGVAFTVLAATYLAIQYMLALKRTWFLIPLGLVAIAEPILLLQAPSNPKGFAVVVLGVQVVAAVLAFTLALRRDPPPGAPDSGGAGPGRSGAVLDPRIEAPEATPVA